MILYHGSSKFIEAPIYNIGRADVDFGQGFYVTSLKEQAVRWAKRRRQIEAGKNAVLNIYEFQKSNLNIKEFNGYCEDWLDFVILNRTAETKPVMNDFDVVFGRVADDDVVVAIDRYIELFKKGHATTNTKQALLDELKFAKPNDQYCIKTEKAIKNLSFIRGENLK